MSLNINKNSYYVLTFLNKDGKEENFKIYSDLADVENPGELMDIFIANQVQENVLLVSKKSISWIAPQTIEMTLEI